MSLGDSLFLVLHWSRPITDLTLHLDILISSQNGHISRLNNLQIFTIIGIGYHTPYDVRIHSLYVEVFCSTRFSWSTVKNFYEREMSEIVYSNFLRFEEWLKIIPNNITCESFFNWGFILVPVHLFSNIR